jgi:glycosyltransferase involved in cell wall biosynthesis
MAAGVVPIAYASDGPSFILEDFPEHLISIGDIHGLAQRLSNFACRRNLEPLRDELRASVDARFAPRVIAEAWKELLQP